MSNATRKDDTALKVDYRSPNNITEAQVEKAIEMLQQRAMPHNLDAEQAVLGAVLLTSLDDGPQDDLLVADVLKVRRMLKPKDFYKQEHQDIWKAIASLLDGRNRVDLVTVTHELRRTGKLDGIGGGYTLVDITNKVGSSAHIRAHANIVLDLSLRREAILQNHLANRKLFDLTCDVFDTRNELAEELRVMPATSFLRVRTAAERMEDGRNAPRVKQMCGSLWKQGEIVFMFSGPKTGKSIMGTQIGIALSKGEGLFNGLLPNECDPQRVGYIDFELQDNEFYERYSERRSGASSEYEFNDNFIMIDVNPDFQEYNASLDKVVFQSIEDAVLTHKLEAIVIDNITWLAQVATSDPQAALDLMRRLDQLRKRLHLSMLVLAHTPKINAITPLDENMMGGSKHLSNFAQGVWAIGKSKVDPNIRYIKECVRRTGRLVHDEENVIQVQVAHEDSMLQYQYMGISSEAMHLNDPNDPSTKLDLIKDGVRIRTSTPKSWPDIYADLNVFNSLGWTERHFRRECQKEIERQGSTVLFSDEDNRPKQAELAFQERDEKDAINKYLMSGGTVEALQGFISKYRKSQAQKKSGAKAVGKDADGEDTPF